MKRLQYLVYICVFLFSCKKWDDYKTFVPQGEVRYPGIDSAMQYAPGNNRVMVSWRITPDPTVKQHIIYWNNNSDSLIVPSKGGAPGDTVRNYITGLPEGTYSFTVYSYDGKGFRSVPRYVVNARSYGALYISTLFNRAVNKGELVDPVTAKLYFNLPDTINISTEIRYTDNADAIRTAYIKPEDGEILLEDYKANTKVAYRSSFIPRKGAIDTFHTQQYDTVTIQ